MPPELRRSLTLPHATAIVVGIIIGASIFIQPSEITRLVPSVRGMIVAWLAAGVLTLCGALVCAELAAVFPETGGVYVFLKKTFSPAFGFLWGWAMFWSVHSGIIAALAVILARYVGYFVPLSDAATRVVASAAVVLLSLINYLGVKPGGAVQFIFTAAKLVAILGMVTLLFTFGQPAAPATIAPPAQPIPLSAYGQAIAAGLFAFGGWHMVTYTAGETQEAGRTIPRALVMGTLIVTGAYILLNAAYLYVLPLHDVASSARVGAAAMERALGSQAGGAIAALVVLSAAGSLNGIILVGPRVYYAMARDGLAFHWLASVHPRRQTPHLAIAAQAAWSCLLVATNTYRQLFTRVVYTEWIFFALLAAGLLALRRRAEYRPTFLIRGYPLAPLLFIVASAGIVINQVLANMRESMLGLGLIILGWPVYFFVSQQPKKAAADAHH